MRAIACSRAVWTIGVAMALASCAGQATPPPTAPRGQVRYLSIGDSFTQGVGARVESKAFPAQLADAWRTRGCDVELSNVGHSGFTSAQVLLQEVPKINAFRPTLITFQVGTNDIVKGVGIDDYRRNVATVFDAATTSGARVVVIPQPEWFRSPVGKDLRDGKGTERNAYDEVMIEEAKIHGAEFVDLRPLFSGQADKQMWSDDGLHPNATAYAEWANELVDALPTPCK